MQINKRNFNQKYYFLQQTYKPHELIVHTRFIIAQEPRQCGHRQLVCFLILNHKAQSQNLKTEL